MAHEKHLIIDDNGFYLKNEYYQFKDVTKISYYHEEIHKRVNFFVKAGIDHEVTVWIYLLNNSKPLRISSTAIISTVGMPGFNGGGKTSDSLLSKFAILAKNTYEFRVKKYIDYIEKYNYFLYDNKKFYMNGDVEFKNIRANLIHDKTWGKAPFELYYENKTGLFSKDRISVSTLEDRDIFELLISEIYKRNYN